MENNLSKSENQHKKYEELGFGTRHVQCLLLFWCLTVAYGMRVTMSVAIVAMTDKNSTLENVATFQWNKQVQNLILGSFFWGYVCMQIPGGQIAHKYGAKYLLVVALMVNGFVALFIPWAAKMAGWQAICLCRVIQGLAQGSLLPCLHTLQGKWAPINERGRISTYVYGGSQFGTVLVMPLSGFLAATCGWPYIFYASGCANLICGIAWLKFGAETPAVHKTISNKEKSYIQESLGQTESKPTFKVPWKSILSSVPMWAMTMAHMGSSWAHVTLFTEIPSYLNKIMGVNMKSNGVLSALPFLGNWIFSFFFSYFSDYFVNKKIISLTTARKLANTISHWGSAVGLIILTFIPIDQITLAVTTLIILNSLKSAMLVGYHVNHIDLAPNFAGTMMSLSNTGANFCSVVAPITAGFVLQDEYDHSQWKIVFYISAGMIFTTNLLYLIFGSAKLMPWNDIRKSVENTEMALLKTNKK